MNNCVIHCTNRKSAAVETVVVVVGTCSISEAPHAGTRRRLHESTVTVDDVRTANNEADDEEDDSQARRIAANRHHETGRKNGCGGPDGNRRSVADIFSFGYLYFGVR